MVASRTLPSALTMAIAFSWRATSTPSLVMTRSGSMTLAPSSIAFGTQPACARAAAPKPAVGNHGGGGGQAGVSLPPQAVVITTVAAMASWYFRTCIRFSSFCRKQRYSRPCVKVT